MKKIKTMPKFCTWDVLSKPKTVNLLLKRFLFSFRFSLSEILFVKKLTSTTLKDAIVYIYMKTNCAFPGISQSAIGIIAKICSPLIMPQSSPNAELIKRLPTVLVTIATLVLLFAVSVLDTIAWAAPPS